MTTEEKRQLEAWLVAVGFKVRELAGYPRYWYWEPADRSSWIAVRLNGQSSATLTFNGMLGGEHSWAGPSTMVSTGQVKANIMALFRDLGELDEHSTQATV